MARLELLEDPDGASLALGDDTLHIGSRRGCDLVLDDPDVAGRHARVEPTRTGWRVRDLGGGLIVNGRPQRVRLLRDGDVVELGGSRLQFHGGRRAATPATKARSKSEPSISPEAVRRLTTTLSALASETDFGRLLTLLVDQVISFTSAERGFLILRTGARKYEMKAARTLDQEPVRRPGLKISRAVAEEVARTGKPLLTTNAQADARLAGSKSVEGMKLRSVLCLPLKSRGAFLGFLYLDHRFEEGAFRREHIGLLEAFADQAAVALEKARLVSELRKRTQQLEASNQRVEELNRLLEEKLDRQGRELDEVRTLLRDGGDRELRHEYPTIVGRSPPMMRLLEMVDQVTETSVPVLIRGESGTGKELIARAIHDNGPRAKRAFVTENCGAIPETLLESALFGHVRGAFTGADADRVGLFEQADGGTLFLDEIGELPLSMQVKLLRVLETGELRRVGGKDTIRVDARILSATHRDLEAMIESGEFREDLYYRIHVLQVRVPPLRDRLADVPALVEHLLALQAEREGTEPKRILPEALAVLQAYDWPGNVRQLRNEVLRATALSSDEIGPEVLSARVREGSGTAPAPSSDRPLKDVVQEAVDRVEARVVAEALEATGWHKGETAERLGVSRPTLDAKIKRHGLERGRPPRR